MKLVMIAQWENECMVLVLKLRWLLNWIHMVLPYSMYKIVIVADPSLYYNYTGFREYTWQRNKIRMKNMLIYIKLP